MDGKIKKRVEEGKWVMEEEVVERVEKWEERGREEEKREKKSERRKDRRGENRRKVEGGREERITGRDGKE